MNPSVKLSVSMLNVKRYKSIKRNLQTIYMANVAEISCEINIITTSAFVCKLASICHIREK